ncbi:hypothetical protein PMAC_002706 [Pneumocystis sp. 'macacae']|nr:hypothetical protein PMAC_002706 [Pneumocystis sp. 'macacae']
MNHQNKFRIILQKNSSSTLDKNSESCKELNNCKIHLLPCHIHWDGPANVSKYFNVRLPSDESSYYATFRGRGLKGRLIALPSDYEGIVYDIDDDFFQIQGQLSNNDNNNNVRSEIADLDEIIEPIKKWHQIDAFSSFNLWDHQDCYEESPMDPEKTLKEWIDLANILHSNTEYSNNALKNAS